MLHFLLPSTTSVRVSSQLTRRIKTAKLNQKYQPCRRGSTSTWVQHASPSARTEVDAEDAKDPAQQTRHDTDKATFSHFFDKRTPLPPVPASSTSSKPKASYEITAASRHAVAAFREAIGTRVPASIIEAYNLLIEAQKSHADDVRSSSARAAHLLDVGFPVRKADIQTAIRYLVQHAQSQGSMDESIVKASTRMFADMGEVFGFRIGPIDLHRQLQTYCLAQSSRYDPCKAFARLRATHPDWQTSSVEWNMIISHVVKRSSYRRAVKLWQEMLELGVEPEVSLRNTMIRVQLAVNNAAEAEAQLQHVSRDKDQLGIDTLTTTVEGLCKLILAADEPRQNLMDKLRTYAGDLRKAVESSPQAGIDRSAWHALLRYEAIVAGPAHALETARRVCQPGLFDLGSLCLLLRLHGDELRDLQSSDEALEVLERIRSAIDPSRTIQPDDQCYRLLMLGLLDDSFYVSESEAADPDSSDDNVDWFSQSIGAKDANQTARSSPTPNQIREAHLLYDHVRALGVPPSPRLVTPLLTAYCEAFLPSLPSAMQLVQDMLDCRSVRQGGSPSQRKSASTSKIGMDVIRPVLNACVKLKDLASARILLAHLYGAGISISLTDKSQLLRQLIGISTSWPEAFEIYRSVARFASSPSSAPARGLDGRGYKVLLESLCALTFPDPRSPMGQALPAPPEELLGIVEDMRSAGYRPSCGVYTSLLDYYAKAPVPSYVGVKATHEMLKRDEGLEPDLPLINALMNAYNRAEEPAMVLAIWDSLLATRQEIDGVTLSVLFDTAGRCGLLVFARKAIAAVRRIESEAQSEHGGFRASAMTKGAWDSWLECLARCGRLEEAIELAFGDMRRTLFRQAIEAHDLDAAAAAQHHEAPRSSVPELVARSVQAPVRNKTGQVIGPDAKSFGTLLRFAAKERDRRQKQGVRLPWSSRERPASTATGTTIWHTLRARIREELSWLYPQIKHIGETPL